jgi:diguanylate cyclase (GGDEF)-like protein
MKSKDLKKTVPAKKVSLRRVLTKNKKIKRTVKQAASELTSINEVLQQGMKVDIPVRAIEKAITQNEDVEHKVAGAADDLHQVNVELAQEVAERVVIESELADTKSDLAEVRDDLSKSKVKERETRRSSLQDALTGLPNRMSFEQHLDRGLSQAKRHGWGLAVLFIDIDKFKSINDSYGHGLGDKVLLMMANRLESFIRDEDTVSRWGGDEFVCLLMEVMQEADVTRLAEKMVDRIAAACEFDGIVLSITASIGIAIYPADGETADALFKNADTAMFKAKGTEKRVVLFRETVVDGSVTAESSLPKGPPPASE